MALPSTGVIEVRTTGSDTLCAGGFNSARGGTDYSQQASAQATGTATSSGTTLTATTGIFTSAMVGNYVTNGTTTFEITAFTSSTVVTVDAAPSWTSQTIYVGGALASPGKAAGISVSGNTIWIGSGTYTVTSASTNIAAGCVSVSGVHLRGYGSVRDDGGRPTIIANGVITTFTMITGASFSALWDVIVDGNLRTSSRGVQNMSVYRVKCQNCTNSGYFSSGPLSIVAVEVTGCTTTAPAFYCNNGTAYSCYVHDNTVTGMWVTNSVNCISETNTGAGSRGVDDAFTIVAGYHFNLTCFGNGSDGFRQFNSGSVAALANPIMYGNGGYGINGISQTLLVLNAALGSNTSGATNGLTTQRVVGTVTLTADPFTNSAGGDFSLNTTAGGGAACRAAAYPGVFPGALTTGYLDIGAVQHQDSGGGSSGTPAYAYIG